MHTNVLCAVRVLWCIPAPCLNRCDKITISPQLLSELQASSDPLPRKLSPDMTGSPDGKVSPFSAQVFDSLHGADQMAVDKLKQVWCVGWWILKAVGVQAESSECVRICFKCPSPFSLARTTQDCADTML